MYVGGERQRTGAGDCCLRRGGLLETPCTCLVRCTPSSSPPWKGGEMKLGKGMCVGGERQRAGAGDCCLRRGRLLETPCACSVRRTPLFVSPWKGGEMRLGRRDVCGG